jgi:hypothetical protein
MIRKENFHISPRTRLATPVSGNNQGHLKDKSGCGQSLLAALPAWCARFDRNPRGRHQQEQAMKPTRPFRRQAIIRRDVRQLRADTTDFDFYRTQAIALRGRAMREATTQKFALAGFVVLVGVLAVGFLAAAVNVRDANNQTALVATRAAPIR